MAKGQKAAPRSTWGNERKSTQNTWKKEKRSVLGADMPKQEADQFRTLCKSSGVSVSAALSQYVRAAIQAGTLDIIRDDIPGTKNTDQKNETPGTVDLPTANDTPGTVDIPGNAGD